MKENMANSNKTKQKEPDAKIVLLGNNGVGKSAITVRYLTKRFIWEYDPSLECIYRHQDAVDNDNVTLEIFDTAGQADEEAREGQAKWADGFMFIYSITDRQSFLDIPKLKSSIEEYKKTENISCIVVGNKNDLEHERKVSVTEGEKMAAEMAAAFFETSACDTYTEVTEAFNELYREVKRRFALTGKQRRRSSAQQVRQVLSKVLSSIKNA
ncbi:ras-related and estrogen-regulated growth inhibitor-like [Tubulanus polymorphus]|uniref:ras-related and estrogen-regulated growth inhibitor-like n=1 Tax=Tubulanus polymorphus TaxID=672921 RepID=UPI003DA3D6B8